LFADVIPEKITSKYRGLQALNKGHGDNRCGLVLPEEPINFNKNIIDIILSIMLH
jgi:hypothetical protein